MFKSNRDPGAGRHPAEPWLSVRSGRSDPHGASRRPAPFPGRIPDGGPSDSPLRAPPRRPGARAQRWPQGHQCRRHPGGVRGHPDLRPGHPRLRVPPRITTRRSAVVLSRGGPSVRRPAPRSIHPRGLVTARWVCFVKTASRPRLIPPSSFFCWPSTHRRNWLCSSCLKRSQCEPKSNSSLDLRRGKNWLSSRPFSSLSRRPAGSFAPFYAPAALPIPGEPGL